MNSNIRKQFGCLIPVLKNCYRPGLVNAQRNKSVCFIKKDDAKLNLKLLPNTNVPVNQARKVSNSSLSKSNESNTSENSPEGEKNKNVLDDEEFKNILSDFAKDFGIGSDSEQILEDIRKSIDDPLTDNDRTSVKDQGTNSNSACHETDSNHAGTKNKFKEFSGSDTVIIPSYEELQSKYDEEEYIFHIDQRTESHFSPQQMKRGVSGVYDIDDLIEVLRMENLADITTVSVPKELHYTDFLVIATANSPRHSKAVCEHVIKLYKMKKHSKDPFVIAEGEKTSNWRVIDMGNIVLHIFLEETRTLYDIESLWLFDAAFDRGGNLKSDPLYNAIEEQMAFFNSLNQSQETAQESTQKTT